MYIDRRYVSRARTPLTSLPPLVVNPNLAVFTLMPSPPNFCANPMVFERLAALSCIPQRETWHPGVLGMRYSDTTGDIRRFAQRSKEGDDSLDETLTFSFPRTVARETEVAFRFSSSFQYLMISNQYATYCKEGR
jgi:hypothetical protein